MEKQRPYVRISEQGASDDIGCAFILGGILMWAIAISTCVEVNNKIKARSDVQATLTAESLQISTPTPTIIPITN